jgi:transcriptional regulator with XRE-family HTH domain
MSYSTYLHPDQIGPRLTELRTRAELSVPELSERAGLDAELIEQAESGDRALAVSELVTVAEALDVDSEALLLRETETAPLFRNEGGAEAAQHAQVEMEGIMSDYLSFKSVVGT